MENPYQAPPPSTPDERPFPDVRTGPERPATIIVFGVLGIVFGSIKLMVCTPISLIGFLMPIRAMPAENPAFQLLANPTSRSVLIAKLGFDTFAAIALLAAGIGLLGMRPWARRVSVGYGCYAILATFIELGLTWALLVAPMMKAAEKQDNAQAAAQAIGGALGGVFGTVITLVYPILLLVFMTRPWIVRALSGHRDDWQNLPELTPL